MSTSLRISPWDYSCYECDSCESKYPCPVYSCSRHGSKAIKWRHDSCGGGLRLYENGKEKCERCGEEELFCLWNCSCYDETKNYRKQFSYHKIKNMLTYLAAMDKSYASTFFLIHLSMCIDKQTKDYPERFVD